MLLKFLILGGFAWLVDVIITLIMNPLNCGRLSAVNLYSLNAFLLILGLTNLSDDPFTLNGV